jgi:hypothetical protein
MACLHREPEVDDVAVPDDVVLALEPELPRLAAPGLAPEAHDSVVTLPALRRLFAVLDRPAAPPPPDAPARRGR